MLIESATDAPSGRRGVRIRLAVGDARIDCRAVRRLCDPLPRIEPPNGAAREALVTTSPGRHLFETRHGLVRFKTAVPESLSANRRHCRARDAAGAKTAAERADETWKPFLSDFEPPPLDLNRADASPKHLVQHKAGRGNDA